MQTVGLTDVTIVTWLTWTGGAGYQRIFDFGTGTAQVAGPSACPGSPGCPCEKHDDCSILCVETPEGSRCAHPCDAGCAEGFADCGWCSQTGLQISIEASEGESAVPFEVITVRLRGSGEGSGTVSLMVRSRRWK